MAFDKDAFLTALDSMTVMELNDLVKAIEEKFGVSAAAMAAPAAGGAGAGAAAAEEKTEFNVMLLEVGPNKVQVIKAVRELTVWASRKPKTWWTALQRTSRKTFQRPMQKLPRKSSKKLARKPNSSNSWVGKGWRPHLGLPAFRILWKHRKADCSSLFSSVF